MPLIIDSAQIRADPGPPPAPITLGLINNMPDAALEATERQFSDLLRAAAGSRRVRLLFSHLPEIRRGPAAADRLAAHYWPLERLLELAPDALIVTGAEPGTGPLTEEPCWKRLVQLVDWTQEHTTSSIWSCLAAHAAVLRLDGIQRRRLARKCFGVFAHQVLRGHPLTSGLQAPLLTPHSRWNELPVAALRGAGYALLSGSADIGADAFAKKSGSSLFVFFQGHPEYEDTSLLKEYRRDVQRFARGEQAHYPHPPHGYFSAGCAPLLEALRAQLLARPAPDVAVPEESLARGIVNGWRGGAVQIYRNWLALLAAEKEQLPEPTSQARAQ
jgi:homoserine O-succinyltransferase/O-acetyltransferase